MIKYFSRVGYREGVTGGEKNCIAQGRRLYLKKYNILHKYEKNNLAFRRKICIMIFAVA